MAEALHSSTELYGAEAAVSGIKRGVQMNTLKGDSAKAAGALSAPRAAACAILVRHSNSVTY